MTLDKGQDRAELLAWLKLAFDECGIKAKPTDLPGVDFVTTSIRNGNDGPQTSASPSTKLTSEYARGSQDGYQQGVAATRDDANSEEITKQNAEQTSGPCECRQCKKPEDFRGGNSDGRGSLRGGFGPAHGRGRGKERTDRGGRRYVLPKPTMLHRL